MAPDGHTQSHREELLNRAYRRGYTLRRRRRWTTTIAGLVVVAITAGGAASLLRRNGNRQISVLQTTTTTTTAPAACATSITAVRAADVPSEVGAWAGGDPVLGEGGLWTLVPPLQETGTLDQGAYLMKVPWYTMPSGLPTIDARRLDGPGTFHASVHHALGTSGAFVTSTLEFSAPGCWQVSARFQSSTLEFGVLVGGPPAPPQSVVFMDRENGLGLSSNCDVPPTADPVCAFSILSTRDAGRTWTRVGGMNDIEYDWRGYPDIELAANGPNIWVYGTRTFASHDGGRTFGDAHIDGLVSALVAEGGTVWVATRACANCPTQTLQSASIGGGPWTRIDAFPDLRDPYVQLARPSASVAYVVGSDTHAVLYRTRDGGRTWQSCALPPPPPSSPRNSTVNLAALGSDQVWLLDGGTAPGRSQEKALYRSDNGGGQWTLLADTGSARPGIGQLTTSGLALGLTVVTPQRIWLPFQPGPLVGTTDGGLHWNASGVPASASQVVFVDPLHGWAWNDGNGNASYLTTNGKDWGVVTG